MYYTIYFDQSNNTWVVLAPKVTTLSYTTLAPLIKGRLYSFQV